MTGLFLHFFGFHHYRLTNWRSNNYEYRSCTICGRVERRLKKSAIDPNRRDEFPWHRID